jgi:hypothetical protein
MFNNLFPASRSRLSFVVIALTVVGWSSTASADSLDTRFLSRAESKLVRREATDLGLKAFAVKAVPPEKIAYSLTLGIAYTDGEDTSKTWSTPFELDAQLTDRRTVLKIAGDGYTHVRSSGESASGLSKVILGASHAFPVSEDKKLVLGGGVAIPTGGELGGSSASQYALVGFSALLSPQWQVTLVGKGIRSNASPASGVSRFAKAGVAQAKYLIGDNDIVFSIDRSQRSGAGGQTNLGIGTDLQVTKTYVLSLGLTRGITAGTRDSTLELDISRDF